MIAPPSRFPLPRFEAVSRRQFLVRSAAFGTLGALALVPGIACSNDDAARLGTEPLDTAPGTGAGSPTTTAASVPATEVAPTSAATQPSATGPSFPAGAQLEVAFTYSASGERVRNPYIAVWVETPAGEMVQTISLWLKLDKDRYLDHLKRWYNAEATLLDAGGVNNLDAVAGASRPAGEYQVVWDGTDVNGDPVAQGDYVLCIEAAREHGPYELVSGPITIGGEAFETSLADNGELSAVRVTFVV